MFLVLDMKSGFHQMESLEQHMPCFVTTIGPLGLYEYNQMEFGSTHNPAKYQRLAKDCLGDLSYNMFMSFNDNLIHFSNGYEEHVVELIMFFSMTS